MKKQIVIKSFVCLFLFVTCLYSYLEAHNEVTRLRMEIPRIARDIRQISEDNMRLSYEIERFENPKHLMDLAKFDEFAHLKHPKLNEILVIHKHTRISLETQTQKAQDTKTLTHRPLVVVGAR